MADITPMDELKAEAVDLAGADFEDEMADQVDEIGKEVKLTPDGGVIKTISKLGAGWDNPEKGDKVTVHYVGTLESGDKFDSSRDRGEPFSFTLGQGQVIKGWDIGVAKMKKGEVATLKIRGDYGYGEAGSPPKIPSNATLIFEVELLEWASVKDIAGDGGVIKTIVKEGKDYQKPKDRDEVCVRIVARVQGAETSFYSSPEEGEEFELDKGHFCPAIATAVKTMLKGEEVHLIVKPEYGFGGEGRTPDVPPNATLEIDLALLSWKKVEKVWDTDGAVTKKVLVESTEWKTPNADAKVKVSYVARLEDGTVFDERSPDNPLEFTTEEGEVVNGLDLAVMKMKKGEKVLLTIPPEWAFGAEGSQQPLATVPPNATVTYEVTVEDFEKPKETWEMSSEEKVTAAAGLKEKGNKAFKEGQLARAVKKWDRAVEMVNVDTNMDAAAKAAAKDVKKSCNLNLAAAYLKLHETKKAIKVATDVLEADSSNLKALYRRAQAYLATGDFVEAEMDIKAGLVLDEANTDFKLLLRKFKQQQAATAKKEAALYSTMFKKLAKAKETSSAAKQQQQQQAEQPAKQPLSENGAAAVAFAPEAAAAEAGAAEVAPMVTETVV